MPTTTITSRGEYNRSLADKALGCGPVVVTHRGRPAKAILSFDEHQRLSGKKRTLLDALAMPCGIDIDFEPPRIGNAIPVAPDFD